LSAVSEEALINIAFVLELLVVIAAIVLLIDANWLFLTEDPS